MKIGMNRITKIVGEVLKVSTIFVVIFVLFFCSATGYNPLLLFRAMTNRCDLSKEMTEIDFVGRNFSLPSRYISDCYPIDTSTQYDYDPASLTLNFLLPNFDPAKNDSKNRIVFAPNELRIFLTGTRTDIEKIDPYIQLGNNKLTFSTHAVIKGQRIQIYSEADATENGLLHYKKTVDAYPMDASNIYLHKDLLDGKLDFILKCDRLHSICDCTSQFEDLLNNVSFSYCYNKEYLPQAVEIDKKVNAFLQGMQKNTGTAK